MLVWAAAWCAPGMALADGAQQDPVFGLWAGPSSIIRVYTEAPGTLQAQVVALENPRFQEGDDGPVGELMTDIKNPDAALRAMPIVGLEILRDYRRKGGKWQGKIYDPESGKTYSSHMRVDRDGALLMRGYIGAPMFGRTAEFVPVSRCTEKIQRMLRSAELPGCQASD